MLRAYLPGLINDTMVKKKQSLYNYREKCNHSEIVNILFQKALSGTLQESDLIRVELFLFFNDFNKGREQYVEQ